MSRFGLCGPAYTSVSLNADCQTCVNLYLERDESGLGKSDWILRGTAGLGSFATIPVSYLNATRRLHLVGSQVFAVMEGIQTQGITTQFLYEVFADGTSTFRGQLGNSSQPVSMASNNAGQLLVASAGRAFLWDTRNSTFAEIKTDGTTQIQGSVIEVAYSDGYFIALITIASGKVEFQISGLNDGNSWDPTDVSGISEFPDNAIAMLVDHREVVFWGPKAAVVYANTGAALFPFEPISGAYAEQGIAATFGKAKLDNTVFWWGADERGNCIAWRAQGYTPVRVSTHAIETELRTYSTVADAFSWSYQEGGHSFWITTFPSANKTWVYDAASGQWHRRASWELEQGRYVAHRATSHVFAFGKHLIGDSRGPNILEMDDRFRTELGAPLRWERTSPYIASEDVRVPHDRFVLDADTGVGPQPPLLDANNNPRDPVVCLQWSDFGGKLWSNEHWGSLGAAGEYGRRVKWRRLGQSKFKGRVYRIFGSDPVPIAITDGYVNEPTERLAANLRKGA